MAAAMASELTRHKTKRAPVGATVLGRLMQDVLYKMRKGTEG